MYYKVEMFLKVQLLMRFSRVVLQQADKQPGEHLGGRARANPAGARAADGEAGEQPDAEQAATEAHAGGPPQSAEGTAAARAPARRGQGECRKQLHCS